MPVFFKNLCAFFLVLAFGIFSDGSTPLAQTTLASLDQVSGFVEVIGHRDKKSLTGKDGTFLYRNDTLLTQSDGLGTVIFREGSEARLFQGTELVIRASEELQTVERAFRHVLLMPQGSLWGHFIHGRQNTEIQTSQATLEVNGTVFRLTDDGQTAGVILTEGSVRVKNETSSVVLQAGQRLLPFNKLDDLQEKIGEIPMRLSVVSEKYQLGVVDMQIGVFWLEMQWTDLLRGNNVKRPARVYLQSNYYNLEWPQSVRLNHNGFARIPIQVKPPYLGDNQFNGQIVIRAVMDGVRYENVGEGNVLINMQLPRRRIEIQVNADSGNILPADP